MVINDFVTILCIFVEAAAARKREQNRERQKRFRERKRAEKENSTQPGLGTSGIIAMDIEFQFNM